MSKKADKFIEKYIVGKDDWLLKYKEVISKLLDEYEQEQLTIPDVSHRRELLAISCLNNITDPINYLKKLAEADGCKLNGSIAVQMTRNGMFYQELANKALKEIDNCG